VLNHLGTVYAEMWRLEEALVCWRESLSILRQVGARQLVGIVLLNLARLHSLQARPDAARRCFEAALENVEALSDRKALSKVLLSLGRLENAQGNILKAQELLERAQQLAQAEGVQGTLAESLWELSRIAKQREDLDQVEDYLRRALEAYRAGGEREGMAYILMNAGGFQVGYRSDLPTAEATYRQALDIAIAEKLPRIQGVVYGRLAVLMRNTGDLEASDALFERSEVLLRQVNDRRTLTWLLSQRVLRDVEAQAISMAQQHMTEALSLAALQSVETDPGLRKILQSAEQSLSKLLS